MVTGAGAPFGRKVVRSGVALEVPSSKIQFNPTHTGYGNFSATSAHIQKHRLQMGCISTLTNPLSSRGPGNMPIRVG